MKIGAEANLGGRPPVAGSGEDVWVVVKSFQAYLGKANASAGRSNKRRCELLFERIGGYFFKSGIVDTLGNSPPTSALSAKTLGDLFKAVEDRRQNDEQYKHETDTFFDQVQSEMATHGGWSGGAMIVPTRVRRGHVENVVGVAILYNFQGRTVGDACFMGFSPKK